MQYQYKNEQLEESFQHLDQKIRELHNDLKIIEQQQISSQKKPLIEINENIQNSQMPQMQKEFNRNSHKENQNINIDQQEQFYENSKLIPQKSRQKIQDDDSIFDIKSKLKKVFMFYTSFGDRFNSRNLQSNKFHKMMNDASIKDGYLTKKRLDLLFCAANKHRPNMKFETFCNLLPQIASEKFPQMDQDQAALVLLQEHMIPLFESIYNETEVGYDDMLFRQEIERETIYCLKHVQKILTKIYKCYFKWETQTCQSLKKIRNRSQRAIFMFLKEFDVCPAIVTKSMAYSLFSHIIDTPVLQLTENETSPDIISFRSKDIGYVFTLSRFFTLIIRMSIIAYTNNSDQAYDMTQAEKFTCLLERMELSQGFLNFEKKTYTPHYSKTSLLLPKNVMQKLFSLNPGDLSIMVNNTNNSKAFRSNKPFQQTSQNLSQTMQFKMCLQRNTQNANNQNQNLTESKKQLQQSINNMNQVSSRQLKNIKTMKNLSETLNMDQCVLMLIDNYAEQLMRIFQSYCRFGEPMNTTQLKSIKWMKMLRKCQLLEERQNFSNSYYPNKPNESKILVEDNTQIENLQRKLNQIDADLVFVKLTGRKMIAYTNQCKNYNKSIKTPVIGSYNYLKKNNPKSGHKGKMNFEHFLKSIELIAEKLYPEYSAEEGVQHIIENHVLQLENLQVENKSQSRDSKKHIKLLMEILKDKQMVELMGLMHQSLMVYYPYYTDQEGYMNIKEFIRFCKEFSIFPDYISKSKLNSLFYTLASIHQNSRCNIIKHISFILLVENDRNGQIMLNKKKIAIEQSEIELIDQHLFVEALALCAFQIPYANPEPSNIEKVCFILEKMNQSQGPTIIQKQTGHTSVIRSPTGISWDLLFEVRKRFPQYFINSNQEFQNQEQQQSDFNSILMRNALELSKMNC